MKNSDQNSNKDFLTVRGTFSKDREIIEFSFEFDNEEDIYLYNNKYKQKSSSPTFYSDDHQGYAFHHELNKDGIYDEKLFISNFENFLKTSYYRHISKSGKFLYNKAVKIFRSRKIDKIINI